MRSNGEILDDHAHAVSQVRVDVRIQECTEPGRRNEVWQSSAYFPPWASRSAWVPCSMTSSFLQHVDAVGVLDGGKPVGDDEGGAVFHQAVERVLDLALGLGIHRGGGLVQQQDRRVLEQRAGDGQPLFLAAGELHAALADVGVELLRQLADEALRVGGCRGRSTGRRRWRRASRAAGSRGRCR